MALSSQKHATARIRSLDRTCSCAFLPSSPNLVSQQVYICQCPPFSHSWHGRLHHSEPRLCLWHIDLDAVRALGCRVLAHRGCSFGCHQPFAGFLPLFVTVGGAWGLVATQRGLGPGWLLWHRGRGPLYFLSNREIRLVKMRIQKIHTIRYTLKLTVYTRV